MIGKRPNRSLKQGLLNTLFRKLQMPPGIIGALFLHSMPGRKETLQAAWAEASRQKIKGIVCLTDSHEIRAKSPDYATAMDTGSVPFEMLCCEICTGSASIGKNRLLS